MSVVIAVVMSSPLLKMLQSREIQVGKSIIVVMVLFSSNAFAFDINGYCRQVTDAVGGSYQIEEACRQQERQARDNLSREKIPQRVANYCQEVGQAVGGSYQIMGTCVQQELAAKARLR